jgi:predicted metal-dependent phosphoesterase TrpH
MMKFDMHMHTRRYSGCSRIEPFDLVRRAQQVGLDGIVITEHDYLWKEDELEHLRAAAPGLVVLAGVEVSARDGDMLVYGVRDPFKLPKGIAWAALCQEIHKQGGVAIAAHPYRWGQKFDEIVREQRPDLDGMELMSSNMDAELRSKAAAYHSAAGSMLAGLGNSDAHDTAVQGCCYTEFEVEIRTTADLVAAIRSRRLTARMGGERPASGGA